MEKPVLIKNGIIISPGKPPKLLQNYKVILHEGLIQKVTSDFVDEKEYNVIDASGKVVLPGFINAHMHFYSTLVRGFAKTKFAKNFNEVLENLWWKLDKILTKETVYYSTVIMLINAIKKGTTTFIDHHASPKNVRGSLFEIAKAVKECGLRACLCYEVSDRDGEKIATEGICENREFIEYCKNNPDEQLKALFGLHASFTLNDKTLSAASKTGNELDVGFHIHCAESSYDEVHCVRNFGMRVVERLFAFGILSEDTILAHCVHINEAEMHILSDTGSIVVHNPQSNLNNAVGIADIIKMQEKGILVGLGTDAMTVNMLEELRAALWVQHFKNENPSCGFMQVFDTLMLNNSLITDRIWNIPLGRIEEGAAADIVLMDYNSPTPLNEETLAGHIIFGLSQSVVDTTIAGGKILMKNKSLMLDIDEKEISEKSRQLTETLWNNFK